MPKKHSSVRPKVTSPSSNRDGDGNHIHNQILLDLPAEESDKLLPKLELVQLKLHQVLHEAGATLKSGYFCNSGMFSVLTVMPDGKTVEVGLIGKEGFSAVPLIAGFRPTTPELWCKLREAHFEWMPVSSRTSSNSVPSWSGSYSAIRCLWQCSGTGCNLQSASRCRRKIGAMAADDCRPRRHKLSSVDAGVSWPDVRNPPLKCNCLSRYLAEGRTDLLHAGNVTILDRSSLEAAACDCYGQLQQQTKDWLGQD